MPNGGENSCPHCAGELVWSKGHYHCPECGESFIRLADCPECGQPLQRLAACGAESYFAITAMCRAHGRHCSFIFKPLNKRIPQITRGYVRRGCVPRRR
ncbi:zinc ribbon domain-containing protein [Plesiomonas shigelloides subsp. oncorhynchi]|nr:zinc ribbon domain-containing protein [Plesiomonas shigelloides]